MRRRKDRHPVEPKFRASRAGRPSTLEGKIFTPAVDVYEAEDEFIVRADVPGAERDEIDISVEDTEMAITARVEDEPNLPKINSEYPVGHWHRRFRITGVDADHVAATLRDGVLEVRLPKTEAAETKRIEIK